MGRNNKSMKMQWIKEQIEKGNYQLKLRAVERASIRGIDPLEVKEALLNGEIIEDYPEDKRGHSPKYHFPKLRGRLPYLWRDQEGKRYSCAMWYGL